MQHSNQLFFLYLAAMALAGCSNLRHQSSEVPVVEAGVAPEPSDAATAKETRSAPANPSRAHPGPQASKLPAPTHNAELLFQAIAAAGAQYRNGGRGHETGFDCSGLVVFVYRTAYGVDLPHNSRAQSDAGAPVARESLQAGDLVFFNTLRSPFSHVGIYVGDGKFIHAPKTGSKVRTENLRSRYWSTRYDGARRIAPEWLAADTAADR